mgnify:CR=1 FL=1
MTNVKIVKATEKHRKDISRMLRRANIGTLSKSDPINNMWVVKHQGRVIACAGLDFHGRDVAVLTSLAVEREFRHHGMGSALINHRMMVAKERGSRTIALVTMYYWFNFYKRRGFRTCPRKDLPEKVRNYWMFTTPRYMKCAVMIQEL